MPKFHLVLLIHAHQPVGNFDEVFEHSYARCYLPFVQVLERCPWARLGLHYSGPLLEWLEAQHPEYLDLLRKLVDRGQVEMVGGGFYEPILVAIPPEDRIEQIRRMADYLEQRFGRRPAGAWLAERVWEPQLPSSLAAAGVHYTLVDDNHFLAAGFELDELHGCYLCEDLGRPVQVFAGLQTLRYLTPFHSVEENVAFLRSAAEKHPGGMAAMGDDTEKFGVWPGTYELCYERGWLEEFFTALRDNAGWLALATPGEYAAANPPVGRADLPTSSYTEMTEWALPSPARARFHALQQEFRGRQDLQPFLRGGFWRNFMSKYSEVNLLHKKMLHVSGKLRTLQQRPRRSARVEKTFTQAATHLLRAQCNDAYWHGIFGGIYAPHLRTALWRELVRAERLTDAAAHSGARYSQLVRTDFEADGQEDLYWVSETGAVLVKPSDGATVPLIDFRLSDATLVNSIQRRQEAYHARLGEAAPSGTSAAVSIHQQVRVKEPGLERYLIYDRWPRHAFRLLVFDAARQPEDYAALRLEEAAALAGGAYKVVSAEGDEIALACEAARDGSVLRAEKRFSFERTRKGLRLTCKLTLRASGAPRRLRAGLETVLNFLAPEAEDRYFETASGRQPLRWTGAVPASTLRVVDEWQNVAVRLEAPKAWQFWVAPVETVSESEEGFERIYQGSQILALWPAELAPDKPWSASLTLDITTAR